MSDETPSKKLKLDVSSNGHAEGEEEEGEGGANQVVREEEVETDQEFVVATQDQENDEDLPDDEEEDDDFEEEEEGEEYMEEGGEEEEEETADHSNAKNIFAVKEITDLIFSGGNFKEGDDLKDSIDFSETCVQQMFGKDILAEDSSAGSPSPGEPRLNSNGAHTGSDPENSLGHSGGEDTSPPAQTHTPSRRGRKRKKFTLTMRKKGRKKKEVEEEEEEFPASYLLSTGLPESDVEELKLGFTVLRDIMSQPCSDIFLCEPEMTEVADKIEYDQLIDKPMWLNLVEQNLCKGVYRNLSDLMCDIRLIVENCYKFWKLRDDEMLRQADVQSKVSWDIHPDDAEDNVTVNGSLDNNTIDKFTVQDIRNKSKLFRLVESSSKSADHAKITKEALEADIIDFENNVVFADGNTIIETVNCMWELADIGHFLCLVHKLLRVPQPTQLEVERMFLLPQSSTALASLMTALLVRPTARAKLERGPPMPYSVWKTRLSVKVTEWYRVYHAKGRDEMEVFESIGIDPMFWNILGSDYNPLESHDYHELHYFQRVWLFKGLCSFVLHNHKTMTDLFNALPLDKARVPPLGSDRQGNAYYFYPDFIDVRLYKQNLPRPPHSVGNYLLLPLHLQEAELQAHKATLTTVAEDRELFFPKQKFLPYRRKDNLVVLANSVEGLEILLDEFREERLDEKLIQSMEELHRTLKRREASIDYVTYKARCAMFSEYTEYVKRPDNYEDPDLKYWNFKIKHLEPEDLIIPDVTPRPSSTIGPDDNTNGDPPDQDGGTRRSRREIHPVLKSLSGPTLSDLELDSEATDASDAASPGFDKDDSEDEWAPQDRRSAKKKPLFSKPPTQGADDKIKPASPEPDSSSTDLDQMSLLPPALRTPGASPAKPDQLGMDDPLNIFSMKRELADEARERDPPPPQEPPPPSRPVIKVKSNQSLVREDFSEAPNLLAPNLAPAPLLLPPLAPMIPPLDVPDPLSTPPLNVKKEDIDDDIEVLEEKVLRPPPGPHPGENTIMKIGNMVYRLAGPPPPGTMVRPPGPGGLYIPGMPIVRPVGPGPVRGRKQDPTQQLVIQNPRTLNPNTRMRGRPSMNPARGSYRTPGPGVVNNPRGVMRGSPRQSMSPRGTMGGRGGYNLTPRKATPPPIPRQLLNRNISVSIVEPKPKPALPKLSGVTITPTKTKPSPAKTLIFNSSPTPSVSKSPSSSKTQMVDANVQLQWRADGSTSYVIELANNQTQELTKEQVQFFKNKHNGTMPNVVRIAVPLDVARRVKPPCITL
ncbi:hypothetical protein M8J75_001385 [Diaphorina citri]|nr:hypothetical protein M8J75_001385 [Diaphorina citri]